MLFQIASLWCSFIWTVEAAVLDPALYMIPSPPLRDVADSVPAAELWQRPAETRTNELNKDNQLADTLAKSANIETVSDVLQQEVAERSIRKKTPSPMARAKLFWPRSRPAHYNLGTIQVPLTFGLTGTYGQYSGNVGMGVVGDTYGTVTNVGDAAVSTLAGSGYGSYRGLPGMRVYGRESGVAWSGWGNGKWGHYGKG